MIALRVLGGYWGLIALIIMLDLLRGSTLDQAEQYIKKHLISLKNIK